MKNNLMLVFSKKYYSNLTFFLRVNILLLISIFVIFAQQSNAQCTISAPTSSSPFTRCGPGTKTITATPVTVGSTLNWYETSSGGTAIATGTSYTTPIITSSTTYYVSAQSNPVTYVPAAISDYEFSTTTGGSLDPMSGATTLLSTAVDDALSSTVTIPFTFNFNNANYTQFVASSNGWLKFGATASGSEYTNSTISTTNIPRLYPYWDDLTTGTNGGVSYVTTGTTGNRIFIIQWKVNRYNLSATTSASTMTFQAWLYEGSNKIEFRYGAMSSSIALSSSLGLTGSASSFQSVTISSNTASNATAVDNNSILPDNGRVYIFNTGICRSTRIPVVVNITTPAFTITPTANNTSICENNSVNLSASLGGTTNGSYTYLWTPGDLVGQTQNGVVPSSTTSYSVTATETATGCSNTGSLTISVNPRPSPITVTPTVSSVCANVATTLVATGGLLTNQTAFYEPFNTSFATSQFTLTNVASTLTASQNSSYKKEGNSSVLLTTTNNFAEGYMASSSINLSNYTSPTLSFYHICGLESSLGTPYDFGYVEYSTDGGTTWTTLPDASYTGSATANSGQKNKFSSTSYSDWTTQFSSATATPGTAPATSLWKKETFNLSAYTSASNFKIRFRLTTDVTITYYGWLIDSVKITGTSQAPITWSPTTYLNTAANNSTPYNGTSNAPTIYSYNTGSTGSTITYTASAAASNGCAPQTATSVLTVSTIYVGDTINTPTATLVSGVKTVNSCSKDTVRITSTPTNPGSAPTYKWYASKTKVTANASTSTITVASTARLRVGMRIRVLGSPSGYGDFNSTATVQSITNATTFVASLAPSPSLISGATIYGEIMTNSAVGTTATTYDIPVDSLQTGDTARCTLLSSLSGGSCTTQPSSAVTSDPIVFNISALPTVSIFGSSGTSVCNGAPNILTANITLSSGTVNSYEWALNGISQGIISSPTNTYNATTAGVYTVTAITNAGCRKTSPKDTITLSRYVITSSAGSNGSISPLGRDTINCGDTSRTYTFIPRANYQISQVIVDGVNIGTPSNYQFTNVTAGHTIRVIFSAVRITCNASADAGSDTAICYGGVVHLSGTRGGTGVSSSTWDNGGALGTFTDASALTTDYFPSPDELAAGSFILNLTTNDPPAVGGTECPAGYDFIVVTVNPVPVLTINGNQGFCPGGSTQLSASASLLNGTITNYKWYNSVPVLLRSTDTITITNAGDYTITVTGSNGCTTSDVARVAQYNKPTVSISGTTPICLRQIDTLTATYTSSGAVPPSGYIWYKSSTLIGGYTSLSNPISTYTIPSSTTTANGYYRVKVTDNLGCVSDTSVAFQLSYDNSTMHGIYTINNTLPVSCTNYWYFNDIIGDLNTRTIDDDVVIKVNPGHTETVPTGGLALGSTNLNNATDPSGGNKKIKFQKDGSGTNPLLTAYTGGTGSPNAGADGIWSLRGVDNVTIDGIDIKDSSANSGGALMDYGYGIFKASSTDGSQRDTIKNCTITLNKNNNTAVVSAVTSAMMDGSVGIIIANCLANNVAPITVISSNGTNSMNAIYGNTIQNCNIGIGLSGFSASSPFNVGDSLNDIGGTTATTGNNILNFGGGGATAASSGIRAKNQWRLNVQYNTINNNNGSGANHANTLRGIWGESGTSATVTISNNNITVKGGGTTQAVVGIENAIGSTAANNTVTISNNIITGSYTTSTNGAWTGITNTAVATNVIISGNTIQNGSSFGTAQLAGAWTGITNAASNCVNVTMNNNSLLNNIINSKGAFTGISTAVFTNSVTMNGNIISGNTKTDTVTAGHYWMNVTTSANTTTSSVTNNRIFNNSVYDTSINAMEVACINHGTANYTFSGNYFSNNGITGVKGSAIMTMTGFRNAGGPLNEIITSDTIRGLYITTASSSTAAHVIRGIFTNTVAGSEKTIANNVIDSLYAGSSLNAVISGIISTNGDSIRIYKNVITNLFPGQSTATNTSLASGIKITSGAKAFIHNNMIGLDLTKAFSPAANNVINNINGLKGIEFTGTTGTNIANVYFNTIHLKGGGATNFGSSGVDITGTTTAPKVYLTNNIIDNQSTYLGTGYAVGIRRASTIAAASDTQFVSVTNAVYAGTPGASNLIYYKGTTPAQALSDFQLLTINGGGLLDSASVTGLTTYLNAPTNLHLASGYNCAKKSAGKYLTGYTTDFDGDNRTSPIPDIGADEFTYDGSGKEGSSTWKGFTTNWNDTLNWCGVLPTSTTDVVIPIKSFNPTISSSVNDSAKARNITVNNGSLLTIAYGGKLKVYGSITATNTINATKGNIELAGSSAQTISSSVFLNKFLRNLVINNGSGVSIGGASTDTLNLLGKLSFVGTGRTFNTNEKLALKSSDTLTASVGDVTGNSIVGNVIAERYLSNRKAWRFLALPTSHNLQTIQSSLQEGGASNSNPYPGYGIQITGTGAGFDVQTTAPSMKTLDPASNAWLGVANTNVLKMQPGVAYMTFIRGDRSVTAYNAPSTSSIIREKGRLITGDSTLNNLGTAANQYVGVGNLYASSVDFRRLTTSNLNSVYYLWDPKVGDYGAYVTCSVNGSSIIASPSNTGSYITGNYNIQSGQGFMVQTSAANASITFKESAKVDSVNLSSRISVNAGTIRTNLYKLQNGQRLIYDGVLNMYDSSYSNTIDAIDAMKLTNAGENLAIKQVNTLLAIERRAGINEDDTIYYQLSQMKVANYQLEILPSLINTTSLEAVLEDSYLQTRTPVSLLVPTNIDFAITQDAGSYAANRFKLVFKTTGALPITSIQVRAQKVEKDAFIYWNVVGELGIKKYSVEKSTDGSNFSEINYQFATISTETVKSYQYKDAHISSGVNYYRIKAIDVNGDLIYSKIVSVSNQPLSLPYSVYPNPVQKDGKINLVMSNVESGNKKIRLVNQSGQVVYSSLIQHKFNGLSTTYPVSLPVGISKGAYNLEIIDTNNNQKTTLNIIY